MGKLPAVKYDLLMCPLIDVIPSDLHPLLHVIKFVSEKRFTSKEEVERALHEYFQLSRSLLSGTNTDIGELLDQVC